MKKSLGFKKTLVDNGLIELEYPEKTKKFKTTVQGKQIDILVNFGKVIGYIMTVFVGISNRNIDEIFLKKKEINNINIFDRCVNSKT